MKRIGTWTVCVGLLLAGAAIAWRLGYPQRAEAKSGCSVASLNGHYIYAQDGFTIQGQTANDRIPFAQVGREHFAGEGHMSGIYSASFNGGIVRGTYAGTYTMNSDCTGTVTFTDNLNQTFHYDIYIRDDGAEFVFVQTDPNVVTAAYERRRVAP